MPLVEWFAAMANVEVAHLALDATPVDAAATADAAPARDLGEQRVAVGHKNRVLAGADSGGERTAATFSRFGSPETNWVAMTYLSLALQHIAEEPINRIDELLAWNVASRLAVERSVRRPCGLRLVSGSTSCALAPESL